MMTLYTGHKLLEITYTNGKTVNFADIVAIDYIPGRILLLWKDHNIEQVDNPADVYKHIACPGRFDIDIE